MPVNTVNTVMNRIIRGQAEPAVRGPASPVAEGVTGDAHGLTWLAGLLAYLGEAEHPPEVVEAIADVHARVTELLAELDTRTGPAPRRPR